MARNRRPADQPNVGINALPESALPPLVRGSRLDPFSGCGHFAPSSVRRSVATGRLSSLYSHPGVGWCGHRRDPRRSRDLHGGVAVARFPVFSTIDVPTSSASVLFPGAVMQMTESHEPAPLPGLPGGLPELTRYCDIHHLPERGRAVVHQALVGDPVRRVGGGGRSVVVRYPSHKMGCVIQAESRNVELVFVEQCEHDPNVLFFLCQPTDLFVRITDAKARRRRIKTVPDYLVLHEEEGFYFVECKPLSVLEKSAADSGRFVRKGSDWSWPAAEKAAAEFGLGYRVFTSEIADRFWVRNVCFLDDFVDAACPDPERAQAVTAWVATARSIRVHELLADTDADPEIVWWLLANGRIAADLQRELCFNLDTSWVHASYELMLATRHRPRSAASHPVRPDLCSLRPESGRALLWDDKPWTVIQRRPRLHHAA